MLKKILSITGKPGLYKIISHNAKNLIVEEVGTGKRMPLSSRDRVVSLGDIAIYTNSEDKPLGEVLDLVYDYKKGGEIDIKALVANKGLKEEFSKMLPDFDEDRVRDSDIKKLFSWYNLLTKNGFDKFTEPEEEEGKEANSEDKESIEDKEK